MGYRADADVLPEEDDGSNFVVRHWNGNLSLTKSWFLVGGALSAVAVHVLGLGVLAVEQMASSLQIVAIAWVLFIALFLVMRIWAGVGIWRSAGKHEARGGNVAWAHVARVLLVLGVLASLVQGRGFALQAMEYGKLALGRDTLGGPAEITVSADKTELAVRGSLSVGTAARFEQLLADSPEVRTVVLNSDGGRLFEAQRMAQAIEGRGLATRVEQHCESACTFALLAGSDRSASRLARIGFHQPDFPGLSDEDRQSAVARARADYRKAGITDSQFIDRAMSADPGQMWYPSHDELVDAGVLTGEEVTVGGSRSASLVRVHQELAAGAAQINARGPTRVDEITTLFSATANGDTLTLVHRIDADRSQVDAAVLRRELSRNLRSQLCRSDLGALIGQGAKFRYAYQDRNGRQLTEIPIDSCREG